MSKKASPHHAAPSHADAKARIERTRREGRYQQALELVKQLYKYEPTAENLELLKDTYFQRAQQLRKMGNLRDAAAVVEVASRLDGANRAWLTQLAQEMAQCADVARLQELLTRLEQLPGAEAVDDRLKQTMLASMADAALAQDKHGKAVLPAPLQAEYDLIVKAFQQVETGQDDVARQTLQGIGLRSPFLEWKVLLRGLQAYYNNDDGRARENWQRLDATRWPARLAAPFRASIDPEYQKAQPPQTQVRLQQQIQSLQATDPTVGLRALQKALNHPDSLANALKQVERLLPTLQLQAPQIIPQLASYFYWSILETGPADLARYRRVFSAPADDPHLHRLNAMGHEQGDAAEAHRHWQMYEAEIAARPELWPGEQATMARALVWLRMGKNAASVPTAEQVRRLPRVLRQLDVIPKPLKPTAEECYRRAIELAPALQEAHVGLFEAVLAAKQPARAIKVGEELIQRFPDDTETVRLLGELLMKEGHYPRACAVFEHAVRLQPMERRLRSDLGTANLSMARDLVLKERYDEARPRYRTALELLPDERAGVLIRWSVAEQRAGDQARADELLAEARTLVGELYVSYFLLVEAHRMALPPKLRTQRGKDFTARLEGPADAETVIQLLEYATRLIQTGVNYSGLKTHVKKIVTLAGKLDPATLTEGQARRLLAALIQHEHVSRVAARLFEQTQRLFPGNPHFFHLQAVFLMGEDPDETLRDYQVRTPLETAARLARQRPADEPGLKEMLADIERRLAVLRALNPFADAFSRMFGGDDGDFNPFTGEFFGDAEDDAN